MEHQSEHLVEKVLQEVVRKYEQRPSSKYIPLDIEQLRKGIRQLVLFLREAVLFKSGKIFRDNALWLLRMSSRKPLIQELYLLAIEQIRDELDPKKVFGQFGRQMIQELLPLLPVREQNMESYLVQAGVDQKNSQLYLESLLAFDGARAERIILSLAEAGMDVKSIYRKVLQPVQYEVGRLWECGKVSVATEHYCTEHTRKLISILMAKIEKPSARPVFLGLCVEGELHSLGIQMVCDYFVLSGWNAFCLGAGVPGDNGLAIWIEKLKPSVIGVSVTLPYHLHEAQRVITTVRSQVGEGGVRILVGGGAFNQYPDLYGKVGADAYAKDAQSAVELAVACI